MNMKIAVVILMALNIAWESFLEVLDQRSLKNKLPKSVADVYDETEYQKWRSYKAEKKRIGVITSVICRYTAGVQHGRLYSNRASWRPK